MKHSRVVPFVLLKKDNFSIIQISELIISFYKTLDEINSNYRHLNIISDKQSLHKVINVQETNSVQLLAEEILHQNIDDIRKIDKVGDPDFNYRRYEKGGISIGLETKIKKDTLISLHFSFYANRSAIGSIVVNELCFDTFEQAKYFLEAANKTFLVDYSAIRISDLSLNKIAREYKAPLGWITYFSNSYEVRIPDDLGGVEYEYTDEGKFLILSKEDIPVDEKMLESEKKKLAELMELIEKKSPEYSKNFTPSSA